MAHTGRVVFARTGYKPAAPATSHSYDHSDAPNMGNPFKAEADDDAGAGAAAAPWRAPVPSQPAARANPTYRATVKVGARADRHVAGSSSAAGALPQRAAQMSLPSGGSYAQSEHNRAVSGASEAKVAWAQRTTGPDANVAAQRIEAEREAQQVTRKHQAVDFRHKMHERLVHAPPSLRANAPQVFTDAPGLRPLEKVHAERESAVAEGQRRKQVLAAERARVQEVRAKKQAAARGRKKEQQRKQSLLRQQGEAQRLDAEARRQHEELRKGQEYLAAAGDRSRAAAVEAQQKKRQESNRFNTAVRAKLSEKLENLASVHGINVPPLCPCVPGASAPGSQQALSQSAGVTPLCWGLQGWCTPAHNCPFRSDAAAHDRLLAQMVAMFTPQAH